MFESSPCIGEYQTDAINFMMSKPKGAIFLPMGTGKSFIVLEYLKAHLRNLNYEVLPVLVVAPKSVCRTWMQEAEKFGHGLKAVDAFTGPIKERLIRASTVLDDCEGHLVITNYEALSKMLSLGRPATVICDESTRIKNTKAARSKAAYSMGRSAKYAWILTGSPIPKGVEDIYGQIYFLDQGRRLGKDYWTFLQRYAYAIPIGSGQRMWQIRSNSARIIRDKVDDLTFRRKREECIQLPAKYYAARYVEMSEELLAATNGVLRLWRLGDRDTTSRLAVDSWLRMLCLGFGSEWADIKCNKYQELLDLIDEVDPSEQVVIWTNYVKENERVYRTLEQSGISVVRIVGETSQRDRFTNLDAFQRGEARCIVISTQLGAFGINELRDANIVVYFSNNYDLELRQQSEDRTYRAGRTKSCTYVDLITTGSIEQHIADLLQAKEKISATFFREEVLRRLECCL